MVLVIRDRGLCTGHRCGHSVTRAFVWWACSECSAKSHFLCMPALRRNVRGGLRLPRVGLHARQYWSVLERLAQEACGSHSRIGNSNGLLTPPRRRRPPQHPPGRPTVRTALIYRPERPGARRSTVLRGVGWGWTGAAGWGRVARRDGLWYRGVSNSTLANQAANGTL